MPVQVILRCFLSGEQLHECIVSCNSTIHELKSNLGYLMEVKTSRLQLLTPGGELCTDSATMLEVLECPLLDLLDPKTSRRLLFEICLYAFVSGNMCYVCEAAPARRCSGCQVTRYCSRRCQKQDWQRHKDYCTVVSKSSIIKLQCN